VHLHHCAGPQSLPATCRTTERPCLLSNLLLANPTGVEQQRIIWLSEQNCGVLFVTKLSTSAATHAML